MRYNQTKWTLKGLLPARDSRDGEELEKCLQEPKQLIYDLENTVVKIELCRDSLKPEITKVDFKCILDIVETFYEDVSALSSYGPLWFSEDTQNSKALAFMGFMEQNLSDLMNRVIFFSLWWQDLDDENANRLMKANEKLKYYLQHLRQYRPYKLSEEVEKVINIKNINGVDALNTVYDMITNRYVFNLDVEGKSLSLTRDGLTAYFRHISSDVRETAFKELYRVYEKDAAVLSQIYVHQVRNLVSEKLNLRSYSSPISSRNLSNDVSDSSVNALLEVCSEKAGVFHRFFELKANIIASNDSLRRYDLYAPIIGSAENKIPYSNAVEMVFECFGNFSDIFEGHARRVFNENHIDSENRKGKRSGAFCYSVLPNLVPWVLVNYTGEHRDVSTIAHELGHAVHSMMAADKSVFTFHSTLPLAETASVFSEMLLLDYLIEAEKDRDVKIKLLAGSIDDYYATILRQSYFVLFEKAAHNAVIDGKNAEDLNKIYLDLLSEQFGQSVIVTDEFKYEWVTIPHIYHTPFYCYAYSFGNLLSLALYEQYKEEGKRFVPKFLKILSYGGSESPNNILNEVGINIEDKGFWMKGFDVIDNMVNRLAEIL